MIVQAKPASTVVLIDEEIHVLMTKRPKSMAFLAGYYVFPGGRMDEDDLQISDHLITGKVQENFLHKGHYISAARELFEEVGIILGDYSQLQDPSLFSQKITSYQKQLVAKEISFHDLLEQAGLQIEIERLQYLGRLITPEQFSPRFDTQFFITKLPREQEVTINRDEIEHAFWTSPENGLELFHDGKIQLAPPTIVVLESLLALKNGKGLSLNIERITELSKHFIP